MKKNKLAFWKLVFLSLFRSESYYDNSIQRKPPDLWKDAGKLVSDSWREVGNHIRDAMDKFKRENKL